MSSTKYQNRFGFVIKKIHQEHLQDKELKPLQISNANLAVYTELGLNILFRVPIKSRRIHF